MAYGRRHAVHARRPGSPHDNLTSDEETAGSSRLPRRGFSPANLFSHRLLNLMVMSDFGSRMGATMSAQVRLDAVIVAVGRFLTSPDIGLRSPVTRCRRSRNSPVLNQAPCVCGRRRRRGSNRFEVCGATPQTVVTFVVTRRYSSGVAELRRAFARR